MTTFKLVCEIISAVFAIASFISLTVKPIREKLFNQKKSRAGEMCLLRAEMLKIYYRNESSKTIRQFELENFVKLYEAYKALGGNSFIEEVNKHVQTWTIIS